MTCYTCYCKMDQNESENESQYNNENDNNNDFQYDSENEFDNEYANKYDNYGNRDEDEYDSYTNTDADMDAESVFHYLEQRRNEKVENDNQCIIVDSIDMFFELSGDIIIEKVCVSNKDYIIHKNPLCFEYVGNNKFENIKVQMNTNVLLNRKEIEYVISELENLLEENQRKLEWNLDSNLLCGL